MWRQSILYFSPSFYIAYGMERRIIKSHFIFLLSSFFSFTISLLLYLTREGRSMRWKRRKTIRMKRKKMGKGNNFLSLPYSPYYIAHPQLIKRGCDERSSDIKWAVYMVEIRNYFLLKTAIFFHNVNNRFLPFLIVLSLYFPFLISFFSPVLIKGRRK